MIQGLFFGALFLIGIIQSWNIYILIALLLFTQTALPNIAATTFSLAMHGRSEMAGSVSALLGFFSTISGGLIAPIVGIGGSDTAVPTAVTIFVCEVLAMLFFMALIKKR